MPPEKDKDMNKDQNLDDNKNDDKDKDKDKNDDVKLSKSYVDSIIRDRDRTKKRLKELEEKLSKYEEVVKTAPPKDKVEKMREELEELRKFREEIKKKQQEAELKDKSESERLKIQLKSVEEDYKAKLEELEEELNTTKQTFEQKLQEKEQMLSTLYEQVLEGRIRKIAIEEKAYSPEQIVLMTKHFFKRNEDGEYYAINKKGKEVTVEEFVAEFLRDPANSNLVAVQLPPNKDGDYKRKPPKRSGDDDEIDVSKATPADYASARIAGMDIKQWLEIQKIKKEVIEMKKQQAGG